MLTIAECLVKILLDEQIPPDNLNGNQKFYEYLARIRQQSGPEGVKRTIRQKAAQETEELRDRILKALAEAERIIAGDTSANDASQEDGDPDIVPPLPKEAQQPIGLLPQVSPWLTAYIKYSRNFSPEGYKHFHPACGLWVLSTVAARRIRVPLSDPVITPLSVIMVARTSLFAKTTTARAAKLVLKNAGLSYLLGDDETTPQRLLADMAGLIPSDFNELSPDDQRLIEQKVAMSGQVGWYYDELNQLLNAMARPGPMADFAGLLRKLDNCEDRYSYSTKGGGRNIINNPYLALLASTTPANLARHASRGAEFWNDGFWARDLFVCPPPDSFETCTMQEGMVTPERLLTATLREWHSRLGIPLVTISEKKDDKGKGTGRFITEEVAPLPMMDMVLGKGVRDAFDRYRIALRTLINQNKLQDLDGSYSRLPTLAMRIAALIASLEHKNQVIMDVWALAQELAELFRKNLHELYTQISTTIEENPVEDLLIVYLKGLQGKGTTVNDIRHNACQDLRKRKPDTLRDMLISLERSGIVTCKREGKKELYTCQ